MNFKSMEVIWKRCTYGLRCRRYVSVPFIVSLLTFFLFYGWLSQRLPFGGGARAPAPLQAQQYAYYGVRPGEQGPAMQRGPDGYWSLGGRRLVVLAGCLHYFRIPRAYWRQRLRQLRAAGFNTACTCVPWGLHNPRPGQFDFGWGRSLLSPLLDLPEFLHAARQEDLFVLLQVGPYVDADLDLGGLPSWLLRQSGVRLRSADPRFLGPAAAFLCELAPIVRGSLVTEGGPVIALQLENEYGSAPDGDPLYLPSLRRTLALLGLPGPVLTSDRLGTATAPLDGGSSVLRDRCCSRLPR